MLSEKFVRKNAIKDIKHLKMSAENFKVRNLIKMNKVFDAQDIYWLDMINWNEDCITWSVAL